MFYLSLQAILGTWADDSKEPHTGLAIQRRLSLGLQTHLDPTNDTNEELVEDADEVPPSAATVLQVVY